VIDLAGCALQMKNAIGNQGVDAVVAGNEVIRVRGARTHNLQGINLDIPLGQLTTISGVSGSGKSSLAFDTIYAEGLHRYLATVSPRTRDLLQRLDRPDVDLIDGLPPTLGIEQRARGPRRRTTLATITDLYDYIRLLFARIGRLHCPTCGQPVSSQSREAIVNQVLTLEERRKVLILSPLIRCQPGGHADVLARITRDGFVRARIDGDLVDLSTPPNLVASKPHSIEVVVDRLVIKEGIRSRVEESIDLALQIGSGQCIISQEVNGAWTDRLYSSQLACLNCGVSFPSIEPGDFSFNSPRGACPRCHGLGSISSENDSDESSLICPDCHGHRLATLPLSVLIEGVSIGQLTAMTASDALNLVQRWLETPGLQFDGESTTSVLQHLIPEMISRLQILIDLGLDYPALDRSGDSLSAGEFQRARLTASLGSQLTGVCYVIDEPTAGLHASDTQRLIRTLQQLRDQGNTLIVVEHDLELIRQSEYTIEIGPGAGVLGGQLVAASSPVELVNNEASVTGRELRRRSAGLPVDAGSFTPERWIRLRGASQHNLHDVTLNLPLGGLVCITGVSGSGKTSLVMRTLVPAVQRKLGTGTPHAGPFQSLEGVELVSRLVQIDQKPLGRSERSTPATYSGVWDEIRKVYAKTRESRIRGYSPRRFSPQHAEGRCPRCAGRGTIDVDRKQLVEWPIRCPECAGQRFNPQTLAVRYRGVSVADLLVMTIDEAATFFANFPRLERPLRLFKELGLGYLQLGQPATTLSGGEAQRVKLATELWKSDASLPTLFVLDEPTSGLHPADVLQMLKALRQLVQAGNSVIVIEHHLDLIAAADWVIDLGPGAGAAGGTIVAEGPPTIIANCESSLTGRALREAFTRS
jgi:excinuclease ABC subunit A